MRIIFTISGNNAQNVGYRLFLLQAMKERGIVGYPINLGDGKQVSIVAWHKNRNTLINFYEFLKTDKPKGIGTIEISPKIIDNIKIPSSSALLNEKMDLMIEQTGQFVQEGRAIKKSIDKLPKRFDKSLGKYFKPIKVRQYQKER